MAAVIRKFVTPWAKWQARWTDPRMKPWASPFFVVDCGAGGFHVGPYVSEQGEIRGDLVRYKDFADAAREMNFVVKDFVAASVWAKGLTPLGSVATEMDAYLRRATKFMDANLPNRQEYLREVLAATKLALAAWEAYHTDAEAEPLPASVSVLPRGGLDLSPEAKAALRERDKRVSIAATERLAEVAGRPTGER